jgi:endonuclease III
MKSLEATIATLAGIHALPAPLTDPLAIIVWENIGYLIDDARRGALFDEFHARIGLEARAIANAPTKFLADIARRGGINAQVRAERLRMAGEIAITECDGDLMGRLRSLPVARARVLLKKFPAIGDPGADRILLFCDIAATPSVESNGLRALARLGFCAEQKSYAQTYHLAVAALGDAGRGDAAWLRQAWLVLREHGRALCKRSAPICEPCPLDRHCPHTLTVNL